MFVLHRTFPEAVPAGSAGTVVPVSGRAVEPTGRSPRPRLLDVFVDALCSARRGRGD